MDYTLTWEKIKIEALEAFCRRKALKISQTGKVRNDDEVFERKNAHKPMFGTKRKICVGYSKKNSHSITLQIKIN